MPVQQSFALFVEPPAGVHAHVPPVQIPEQQSVGEEHVLFVPPQHWFPIEQRGAKPQQWLASVQLVPEGKQQVWSPKMKHAPLFAVLPVQQSVFLPQAPPGATHVVQWLVGSQMRPVQH